MATVRTISLKEFVKEFGKDSKYLKRHKKQIYEAVYNGCLQSVEPMAKRSPVDTGLYASAWETRKVNQDLISFGNTAPYAVVIEKGARPFSPPIGPLLAWASRQLQLPEEHPEVRSFAYGIKKTIEREGMEPKNILEKGIEEVVLPNIRDEIDRVVQFPKEREK